MYIMLNSWRINSFNPPHCFPRPVFGELFFICLCEQLPWQLLETWPFTAILSICSGEIQYVSVHVCQSMTLVFVFILNVWGRCYRCTDGHSHKYWMCWCKLWVKMLRWRMWKRIFKTIASRGSLDTTCAGRGKYIFISSHWAMRTIEAFRKVKWPDPAFSCVPCAFESSFQSSHFTCSHFKWEKVYSGFIQNSLWKTI